MRTRIVSLALIAAVAAVALFGIPLAVGLARYALDDEATTLQRLADLTASSVLNRLAHDETPPALPDPHDDTLLALYDSDGVLLLGDGPRTPESQVDAVLTGAGPQVMQGGEVIVTVPVTGEHEIIGAVRAARPSADVYAGLIPIWLGMVALAGIVLAAVWLISRRQASRLAHPLEDLAELASRLGDGDFSVRARAAGVPEVDAVGAAFTTTAGRLDDILARERAFSAEASHQLRTPLAALRLRLETAANQTGRDLRPVVTAALADADRLDAIVEELLALSRDRHTERAAPLPVDEILSEAAGPHRGMLAATRRELRTVTEPGLPAVLASPTALRQVLAVLLDNAERHGAGTVTLTAREEGDAVALDVADEGPGPRDGTDPFDRSAARGHGIGLALARRLTEDQAGRLLLSHRSPPVFTVYLHAADAVDPAGGRVAAQNGTAQNSTAQNAARKNDGPTQENGPV